MRLSALGAAGAGALNAGAAAGAEATGAGALYRLARCRGVRYSRFFFLLNGYFTIFIFYTDFANVTFIDNFN